ncbi:PrsW family intramembrane metalloprotease [Haloglycomyces albus]|uniref:PrsW family intramembrane metalloprotease n=1 Tax=Haloglycomyces albus TaxID=526067 RepID=UPI00046D1D54|nr:PrsW family intramembrane metalloprotease [Haloglycomyces albus]
MTSESAVSARLASAEPDHRYHWSALLVILIGLAAGAWSLGRNFAATVWVFAGAAALNVVFLSISLVVGLWLARRLMRPVAAPPWSGTWIAVLWGGLGAIGISLAANTALTSFVTKALGFDIASEWGSALVAPINEETAKLLGVILLAAVSTRLVRSPSDGFVYGALVGLGFQVVENLTYGLNSILGAGGVDPAAMSTLVFGLRTGTGFWGSHWAMSAVAGAGIGYLVANRGRSRSRRATVAVSCWLLAMAMHWQFNSPLLSDPQYLFYVKSTLNLVIALVVFLVARRAFRTHWKYGAADEVDRGALFPQEATALSRRRARARYLRRYSRPGRQRYLLHLLLRRQLRLLEDRAAGCPGDAAEPQRADIADIRATMAVSESHESG